MKDSLKSDVNLLRAFGYDVGRSNNKFQVSGSMWAVTLSNVPIEIWRDFSLSCEKGIELEDGDFDDLKFYVYISKKDAIDDLQRWKRNYEGSDLEFLDKPDEDVFVKHKSDRSWACMINQIEEVLDPEIELSPSAIRKIADRIRQANDIEPGSNLDTGISTQGSLFESKGPGSFLRDTVPSFSEWSLGIKEGATDVRSPAYQ